MKRVLPVSNFTFQPTLNRVDFSPMGGGFKRENLYAVINITTGKLVYAVASVSAGFGGTFVGNVLTYSSSNAGQLASDVLQVIYDDETMVQNISGSVTIQDPATVQGNLGSSHALPTAIHDGSGTYPILSTPDPLTLREGLDVHVQSSSVQGLLNNPLPLPYQNQALSVGYINGGDLVTPAMNIGTNELIVDATQSGPVPVDITGNSGPLTVDIGSSLTTLDVNLASSATTLPVSAVGIFPVSASILPLPSGASTETTLSGMSAKLPATLGQKPSATSMAVVLPSDQVVPVSQNETYTTGALTLSLANNIFNAVAGPNSTDALGFKSGAVQVVTSATTGALIFEHSNDNINYQPMPVFRTDSASPNAVVAQFTPVASSFVYHFPIKARYIRCRIATALNQNAQAFLRLSQESWAPIVPQVINATAANLNATVGGTVAISSGTITTVSTVTTCSSVTSAALAGTTTTDIASATITSTQTSGNVAMTNIQSVAFQIAVTATSGTGQTLDVVIQETFDGINFYDLYHFPRITAIGQYQSPQMRLTGIGIRYIRTVGGTTPSFTMSGVRISRQIASDIYRNFLSRTIDPNTLNSTTSAYLVEGADEFQLVANMNGGGIAPDFKMQGSEDGANWFDIPSMTLTATAGSVTQTMTSGQAMPKFIRGIVSTAGVGSSLVCLHLKARGV